MVHFHRNVANRVPSNKVKDVARMLKAIYAQENLKAAESKTANVCQTLREMKLTKAADLIEEKIGERLVLSMSFESLGTNTYQ